ncbi:MAG: hypothetical protein AAGI09_02905 [Pseudomonadota bacterium]
MIAPDLFQTLPKTIAERISVTLPGLNTCEAIWGLFNPDELKKRGVKAPAVLVSCAAAAQSGTRSGPEHDFDLRMLAYVITRDALGLPRDVAAAGICGTLMRTIPDRRWGPHGVGEAKGVRCHPLINEKTRDAAYSLFVVEWIQPVALAEFTPDDPVPLDIYVGIAPETGPDHLDDYDLIGGDA